MLKWLLRKKPNKPKPKRTPAAPTGTKGKVYVLVGEKGWHEPERADKIVRKHTQGKVWGS